MGRSCSLRDLERRLIRRRHGIRWSANIHLVDSTVVPLKDLLRTLSILTDDRVRDTALEPKQGEHRKTQLG